MCNLSAANKEIYFSGFIEDSSAYLEHLVEIQEEILVVGDLNVHVDCVSSRSTQFVNILGLKQHVNKSTFRHTH